MRICCFRLAGHFCLLQTGMKVHTNGCSINLDGSVRTTLRKSRLQVLKAAGIHSDRLTAAGWIAAGPARDLPLNR